MMQFDMLDDKMLISSILFGDFGLIMKKVSN